jgi:hypothetical protein
MFEHALPAAEFASFVEGGVLFLSSYQIAHRFITTWIFESHHATTR